MTEVDRLARAASDAFASYGGLSGRKKGELLRAIAERLEANGDAIAQQADRETSLGMPRLKSELARTCNQIRMFAALVDEGSWVDARIDHAKVDIRSMRRPLGPVAVFGASNFPLAFSVPGGDTASALAAGGPVIVKAHPAHPETSRLTARAISEVTPEGVFALIEGFEAGVELVKHPLTKAVAFTGSRKGGRALMDVAAARLEPIPVYAEMGSINPVFILPRALRERGDELAAGLQASVTLGVGQFCTNPGLVFVEAGDGAPQFLAKLGSQIAATPPGTMLTAGLCSAYHAGVEKFSRVAGVKLAAQAKADPGPGKALAGAALFLTDA